jgi:arsenate reductase-like glutaredoxin family protein
MEDFTKLDETKHMLEWLAENPYDALIAILSDSLQQQVEGSEVKSFLVTSDPHWLTAGRKKEDDETKMILTKTGVAFEFEAVARENGSDHQLKGVIMWVGYDLDQPGNQRTQFWLDLDSGLEESKEELMHRLYS